MPFSKGALGWAELLSSCSARLWSPRPFFLPHAQLCLVLTLGSRPSCFLFFPVEKELGFSKAAPVSLFPTEPFLLPSPNSSLFLPDRKGHGCVCPILSSGNEDFEWEKQRQEGAPWERLLPEGLLVALACGIGGAWTRAAANTLPCSSDTAARSLQRRHKGMDSPGPVSPSPRGPWMGRCG